MATQDLSQILPFLQMLQGGGDSQIQPVSGLSQPVPLSGLPLGEQGMGLGGGGSLLGATPGGGFGGPGGAGLDFFQLMSALQGAGDVGAPSGGFLGQPGGGGTVGQGFGAGGQLQPQQQGVPAGTAGQAGLGGGGGLGDISVLLKTIGQLSKVGQVPTASPTGFPEFGTITPEVAGTPGLTGTAQTGVSFIDDPVLFQKALGQAGIAPAGGAELLPGALQSAGGLDLTGPLSLSGGLRGAETPFGQPGGATLGQEGGSALGGLLGPALTGLPFGVELGTRLASGEGINAFPTTGLHALPFTGLGDTIGSLLGRGPSALTGVNPFARFGLGAATGGLSELFGGLFGGGGPSRAYRTFGNRLGETLNLEQQAVDTLAQALTHAGSRQDVASDIGAFRQSLTPRIGGFGAGAGPFDIPSLPGATGSRHEGGLVADFGPQVQALQQMVAALLGRFPETA